MWQTPASLPVPPWNEGVLGSILSQRETPVEAKRGVFKGPKQGPRTELRWGFARNYFQKLEEKCFPQPGSRGKMAPKCKASRKIWWATHKQQYKQQMYPGNATVDVIFHKNMAL